MNRFKSFNKGIGVMLGIIIMPFCMMLGMGDVMAESYLDKTQKLAENIWVGPQVSVDELKALKAENFTQVINFRTKEEMQALSFNEAALLKAEGLGYNLIPMGKELGYTPDQLTQFNSFMTSYSEEKILLHCRSGYRANLMYAAWLIKYQGMSKGDAKQKVHAWSDEAINKLIGAELVGTE